MVKEECSLLIHEIYEKVWSFRDHGKTLGSIDSAKQSKEFSFVHKYFGSNFRMTEMQSAIGRIQLSKINEINKIRTKNASIISNHLSEIPLVRIPIPEANLKHAWYKFYCYLNLDQFKKSWNRAKVIEEINNLGYPAFSGGCSEIYLEECFSSKNIRPISRLRNARILGETSLMFLVHNSINSKQMNNYALTIKRVLEAAVK